MHYFTQQRFFEKSVANISNLLTTKHNITVVIFLLYQGGKIPHYSLVNKLWQLPCRNEAANKLKENPGDKMAWLVSNFSANTIIKPKENHIVL